MAIFHYWPVVRAVFTSDFVVPAPKPGEVHRVEDKITGAGRERAVKALEARLSEREYDLQDHHDEAVRLIDEIIEALSGADNMGSGGVKE